MFVHSLALLIPTNSFFPAPQTEEEEEEAVRSHTSFCVLY